MALVRLEAGRWLVCNKNSDKILLRIIPTISRIAYENKGCRDGRMEVVAAGTTRMERTMKTRASGY